MEDEEEEPGVGRRWCLLLAEDGGRKDRQTHWARQAWHVLSLRCWDVSVGMFTRR